MLLRAPQTLLNARHSEISLPASAQRQSANQEESPSQQRPLQESARNTASRALARRRDVLWSMDDGPRGRRPLRARGARSQLPCHGERTTLLACVSTMGSRCAWPASSCGALSSSESM